MNSSLATINADALSVPSRAEKTLALYATLTDLTLAPLQRLRAGEVLETLGWTVPDIDELVAVREEISFWIGKYPVTNLQYARFVAAPDYAAESVWRGVIGFAGDGRPLPEVGDEAWRWFLAHGGKERRPEYWDNPRFGMRRRMFPVVGVAWYEAAAYCVWLTRHRAELDFLSKCLPQHLTFRLPLETEWVMAAGGEDANRYPWQGEAETSPAEQLLPYANLRVGKANLGGTTPVGMYPAGQSPLGVMDMVGNVWEWQANVRDGSCQALRGGSWLFGSGFACVGCRNENFRYAASYDSLGFRVAAVLPPGGLESPLNFFSPTYL